MKKIYHNLIKTFWILVLLMITTEFSYAATVNEKQAQVVAENFLKSKTGRASNKATLHYAQTNADGSIDFYVFNFLSPKGFVIVTGDDRVKPIIAYSDEKSFDISIAEKCGVSWWMNKVHHQIQKVKIDNIQPEPGIVQLWNSYLSGTPVLFSRSASVGPLLTTEWDQSPEYNSLCPDDGEGDKSPTGCVATAMAQIMKYWNYPANGTGTHSYTDSHGSVTGSHSVNLGTTYYDWSNMPLTSANTEIATLMYHCGVSVEMDYEIGLSSSCMFTGAACSLAPGVSGYTAQDALVDHFGYSSEIDGKDRATFIGNWINMLKEELDLNHPIMYSGATNIINGPFHTWVCDGYDNSDLFHMNWGWGGDDDDLDGFYDLDNITPFGNDFDNWEGVLVGIKPPGCIASYEGEFPVIAGIPISLVTNDYIQITGGTIESGIVNYNAFNKIVIEVGSRIKEGVYANLFLEGCGGEPFQGDEEIEARSTQVTSNEVAEGKHEDLIIAPNPFSYSTNLQYTLSGKQEVSITVFNSAGTVVARIVERQFQEPGEYNYTFDAFDFPPGLYLAVLQKGGERIAKRIALTK